MASQSGGAMISQHPITQTAAWKDCVIRTRIYFDLKGRHESLTRNHNAAVDEAQQTWHITTIGNVTANHQADPTREYRDDGLRITNGREAIGYRFHNVAEMIAAANQLEESREPISQLCVLRLRLACTGWDFERIADYLSLSRRMLRRLDKLASRVCEMHEPRNRFYQVPLARKRKPRAGWAKEILQRYFRLRKEIRVAKSSA
jgi:hypothetical protein